MNNNQQSNEPMVNQGFPNNVLIVILAVVITALLVGGAMYYYQTTVFNKEKNELEDRIEELENQLVVVNDEDPYKDWQTYRSEEYGFEMKYPSDWPQSTMNTRGFLSGGFPSEKSRWTLHIGTIGQGPCEGADCAQYQLSGFSYMNYNSVLSSIQSDEFFISEIEEMNTNGLKIITYAESGLIEYQTALIFGPTQTLKLTNVWGEEGYFYQILPTFKFTDQ